MYLVLVVLLISLPYPHSFHAMNELLTSLSLAFCKTLMPGFVPASSTYLVTVGGLRIMPCAHSETP